MVLLTLSDVSLTYDDSRPLLDGVSLTVGDGDRIGLIGANGSGKSTLLKIMANLETPESGERVVRRDTRVGYLEQEPQLDPALSVRDVVRAGLVGRDALLAELDEVHAALDGADNSEQQLGRLARRQEQLGAQLEALGGHEVEHLVEATLHHVGLTDLEAPCAQLSGGEARRAALARLLIATPDLLLLDEPTNHLDALVVTWLADRLIKLPVPVVLVTHDRFLLDRVTDRIVELEHGALYEYTGGYRRYVEQRAERLASEEHTQRARLNLLRRETAWMRRGPPARTTKAKARIGRFETLSEEARVVPTEELQIAIPPGPRFGSKGIELHGASYTIGERQIVPPLDLEVTAGMRLGIVGPNGAGKTTLVRLMRGELTPTSGRVVTGDTVRFGSVDQHRTALDPEHTVVEAITGGGQSVIVNGHRVHVATFLDGVLFPGERKHVKVGMLSGGERARVLLARLLLSGANTLVLDEPTNDLDLMTLRALEEALVAFAGAVIVVSHDRWFLDRVATHVLHLDGHGGIHKHIGDASALLDRFVEEQRARRDPADAARRKRDGAAKAGDDTASARVKPLSPWERRELEKLGDKIAAHEESLASVDTELADPEVYKDVTRVKRIHEQRAKLAAALELALARWEELAERDV